MTLSAIYQEAAEGGYAGFVAELPGAVLVLEGNRILAEEALLGRDVVREPLIL